MARKFKTTLIAAMLVDDTGELQRNGKVVEDWNAQRKVAIIDGIKFDPWQAIFVDLLGEFEASDFNGGKHKFFRTIQTKEGLRPLQRSDVKEGKL